MLTFVQMTSNSGLYQLHISLSDRESIDVGRFGKYSFPKGNYIYTGSAKRGLNARIDRHKRNDKKLHWHIDFLLGAKSAKITKVEVFDYSSDGECALNQSIEGKHIVNGFGASDCQNKCISHLVYIGK